jgi:hypothetical protein
MYKYYYVYLYSTLIDISKTCFSCFLCRYWTIHPLIHTLYVVLPCVYIYIYIHTNTHTHVVLPCVYVYTYIHTYIHTHTHACGSSCNSFYLLYHLKQFELLVPCFCKSGVDPYHTRTHMPKPEHVYIYVYIHILRHEPQIGQSLNISI